MQNTNTNGPGAIIAAFVGLGFFAFLILLVIWAVLGAIAWFVAPVDRSWTFFWLTFLLLGPLGVLAASVASPRDPTWFADAFDAERPRAKGRERYWCSLCGALSDLLEVKDSSCWRCGEQRFIATDPDDR